MPPSFIDHLLNACRAPLDEKGFGQGYAQVLQMVASPGMFTLHGMTLEAPAGVYSPHETSSTRFVLDHFRAMGLLQPAGSLLEVGCGAGGIAIRAAQLGWKVSAADIDPVAVDATQRNAARNAVSLEARVSDLFAAFEGRRFDVIVFNQPFFHTGRAIHVNERTLSDGFGELHVRFLREAPAFLQPGGRVLFSYANCGRTELLNQPGWELRLLAFDFDSSENMVRALFEGRPQESA